MGGVYSSGSQVWVHEQTLLRCASHWKHYA